MLDQLRHSLVCCLIVETLMLMTDGLPCGTKWFQPCAWNCNTPLQRKGEIATSIYTCGLCLWFVMTIRWQSHSYQGPDLLDQTLSEDVWVNWDVASSFTAQPWNLLQSMRCSHTSPRVKQERIRLHLVKAKPQQSCRLTCKTALSMLEIISNISFIL